MHWCSAADSCVLRALQYRKPYKGYKEGGDTQLPVTVTYLERKLGFCRRANSQTCRARPPVHVGARHNVLSGLLVLTASPEDKHCLLPST